MNRPIVSVITPCYNQGCYLSETLNSVLAQTFQSWECIIVNDGSTDNTEEVASSFVEQDKRFKYYYKENSGVSDTRNYGVKQSSGEFILPLDGDDLIGANYMKMAVEAFNRQPELKVVFAEGEFLGNYSGHIELKPYNYRTLLLENTFFNSVFFKRVDFDRISGYSVEMRSGWEDWELLIRLLDDEAKVYKIPEVFYHYRILPNSRERTITENDRRKLFLQIYNNNKEAYNKHFADSIFYAYLYNKEKNENQRLQQAILSIQNSRKYRLIAKLAKIISFRKK